MYSILIIDDDESIGNMEQEVLESKGYLVQRAFSGTEALLLLQQKRPDLILLDLMLPGMSGEELLPQIQGIPVIVVSAKTDADSKVNLLLGGAVDYLTKPFDTKELLARINIRLRERMRTPEFSIYNYGELTIDETLRKVSSGEKTVTLTRTEFAILKLLVQNSGQVIAKSVLLDRISLDTPDCTENSLKTHISHLRGKLREISGKEYVESVWGIGFRWKSEVMEAI
ncbi:MAG TPA: DNA-binding response regulator [Lachnospiraceae bacterium]|nr:DNA-binding response regulator [Lachnospiraceae bacterium]